jgi:hypothetical protein
MSQLPPYYLRRPAMPGLEALAGFDRLLTTVIAAPGGEIDFRLPEPKWQFLCHLADAHGLLLHGSTNPGIELFEPRKADDVHAFGDRLAVYAASDGIWPLYYAILDRQRFPMSLNNACIRVAGDAPSEPHYFFSISQHALAQRPFRNGWVNLLPRESFEQQPPLFSAGLRIELPQWASPVAMAPLARLAVDPEDFPFLAKLRGHDDKVMFQRARQNPDGFPWLDDAPSAAAG